MQLEEIKRAVDAGRVVHWANDGYRVIKDSLGRYLIGYGMGTMGVNYIGLTHHDGRTLNGRHEEFYVAGSKA